MKYPFIFATGGTGGHIFPAISVAKNMDLPVIFLTGKYGMERKIFEGEKIKYKTLPLKGISGIPLNKKIIRSLGILFSLIISLYYILKFNPKIIVGFGGYASFPVLFWARILNKKYFLQEQNSIPGFVTRTFSKKATAIFTGFPQINLEGKKFFTGNPLRKEFYDIPPKEKISFPLNIFIIGGSQGSKFLDEVIIKIIPEIKDSPLKITHQAKRESIFYIEKKYKEFGLDYEIFEFTDKPWEYYSKADLVICRAGALTVSEVISSGRCAIFVPFKGAAENHQYFNATYLSDSKCSFLIEENEHTGKNLLEILKEILKDPQILIEMGKRTKEKEVRNGIDFIKKTLLENLKGGNCAL